MKASLLKRSEGLAWKPPEQWPVITTVDAHTGGEPLRIILGGIPEIPGKSILEKRKFAQENLDGWRRSLMWEPRGHADMYGAILTDPVTDDGDFGVLFLHNEGFSTMCGHGIIALAKVVLETGIIEKAGENPTLCMDTPAGRVTAVARRSGGIVTGISFINVPSFVYARDLAVAVPGIGRVRVDVAFGGAFYAFCEAKSVGITLGPERVAELIDAGMRIKRAVDANLDIRHPFEADLGFLYGTIFVGEAQDPEHHSRNVCIFAEGEVDRSPTGTGVSARAAIHHARRELAVGENITVESILGTTMQVCIEETVDYGPYEAVIPKVSGSAHLIGQSTFFFDPDDRLSGGFLLR